MNITKAKIIFASGLPRWSLACPGGADSEESACNAADPGLISGSRRFPGEGNGNPFQYSCMEKSMDRGA